MSKIINLTDRIVHLRESLKGTSLIQGDEAGLPENPSASNTRNPCRQKFSSDYFMFFVYTLLGLALLSQIGLIVWLDLI